jgi:hypothetical protein
MLIVECGGNMETEDFDPVPVLILLPFVVALVLALFY